MTNKNKFLLSLCALALTIGIFSCSKDKDEYLGSEFAGYYPLTTGHFVEYDVDSTIYDDFLSQTFQRSYQMRYTVQDTFTDNAGDISYRVVAEIRRKDSNDVWKPSEVFYVTPSAASLDVTQNNMRFVKLINPVENGRSWDGNSKVTADGDFSWFKSPTWNYTYENAGKPYNNGRVEYQRTVTVNEVNDSVNNPELNPEAIAIRTYSQEIYGYDVGLVYREFVHWVYDPGVKKYRRGFGVVMRATNHN